MLREHYGPWALIAGGSEGIGASFAHKLAADRIHIVLVARKPEPLEALAADIRKRHGVEVRTLSLDLTAPDALDRVRAKTDDIEVGLLIYNAGTDSTAKHFLDRSVSGIQRVIALNVTGQALFAHHFGNLMRARKRGGMILVGALMGYAGGGFMTLYAATKAFIHALAKGLWIELEPFNVHVLGLVVSATKTPAYTRIGGSTTHNEIYAEEPDVVAQEGLDQLPHGPIWVPTSAAAFAERLKALPDRDAVKLVARMAAEISEKLG
jgi:short-subunit dehydrogenase